MNAREFEEAVWNIEKIRIRIRVHGNRQFPEYDYDYSAWGSWTIRELFDKRLRKFVGDEEIDVIDGREHVRQGNTVLDTVRGSY